MTSSRHAADTSVVDLQDSESESDDVVQVFEVSDSEDDESPRRRSAQKEQAQSRSIGKRMREEDSPAAPGTRVRDDRDCDVGGKRAREEEEWGALSRRARAAMSSLASSSSSSSVEEAVLSSPSLSSSLGPAMPTPLNRVEAQKTTKAAAEEEEVPGDLKCTICLELYHNAVSLVPCSHVFCGGCISACISSGSKNCPNCRTQILIACEAPKPITNMVDEYIRRHPTKVRDARTLRELDATDRIKRGVALNSSRVSVLKDGGGGAMPLYFDEDRERRLFYHLAHAHTPADLPTTRLRHLPLPPPIAEIDMICNATHAPRQMVHQYLTEARSQGLGVEFTVNRILDQQARQE